MPKRCWNLYSLAEAGPAEGRAGQGPGSSAGLNVAQSHGAKVGQAKNKINYVACSQWSC